MNNEYVDDTHLCLTYRIDSYPITKIGNQKSSVTKVNLSVTVVTLIGIIPPTASSRRHLPDGTSRDPEARSLPFPLDVSHAPPSIRHDPFQYALFYFTST